MYTIKGFVNGELDLLVNQDEYNKLIPELNKIGLLF